MFLLPDEGRLRQPPTDVVVNIPYLKSTIDQINFEGVDKDRIWEIRDFGFAHPEFQP